MEKNENIEITRILDLINSKKIIIVFILVIFILIGYFYSYHYIEPKYRATSTLLLIPNTESQSQTMMNTDLSINSGLIETYRSIGENSKILKQVIENLGLDMTEQQLLEKMKIKVIKDTYMIEVNAISQDPKKARDIVQEFDTIFLKEIKQIYHLNNVGIVDEPQLPQKPYNINPIKDMVVFFVIGIGATFAYIMIIYLFDNTIKKEEEIEKYIQIKSLGNIPIYKNKKQEIVNRENAKSYITECINTIRTNILYRNCAKTILITSCTPQEGKSWVSSNLAIAFAETNQKVLLIDGDMRKGRLHKIFKKSNQEGLSNYLTNLTEEAKHNVEIGKNYIQETNVPNLHIITNGTIPPNPAELIENNNIKELLENFKDIYDIIIIDAPPCKLVTDSIVLSTIVEATILVANSQKTKIKDFTEVKKAIQMVGGEIIGAILNKKKIKAKNYSKNYYYETTNTTELRKEEKQSISVEDAIRQVLSKEEEVEPMIEADLTEKENLKEDDRKTFIYDKLEEIQINLNKTQEMIRQTQANKHKQETELQVSEKILQLQEEIAKMNYQEQINQISETLAKLNDNYLALSNQIEKQEIEEEQVLEESHGVNKGKNIIDFKAFKRQRNKKKIYSIYEDIFSEDLEQTATYVLPLDPFANKVEKTM